MAHIQISTTDGDGAKRVRIEADAAGLSSLKQALATLPDTTAPGTTVGLAGIDVWMEGSRMEADVAVVERVIPATGSWWFYRKAILAGAIALASLILILAAFLAPKSAPHPSTPPAPASSP